jgi:hypothetical protein
MFGIPEAWAWKLMPVVGAVDISIGVLTLIQPVQRDQEIRQLPELALTKLGGSRR